jgi:hypothetical protein
VNINQLFYNQLKKKGIDVTVDRHSFALLVNRTDNPDTLFKCNFSKRYDFSILSREGKYILPYSTDSINVFLKVNGKGDLSAGGITNLRIPAAQFGGSFLLDFDTVTFDPFRSLIWFRKPR